MKKQDPFAELVKAMRSEGAKFNPPSLRVGVVTSVNPLLVKLEELQLTKEDILIDASLIEHNEEFSLDSTPARGSVSTGGNLSNLSIEKGSLKIKTRLKKDDLLVLIPTQDKQIWIILSKVVRP